MRPKYTDASLTAIIRTMTKQQIAMLVISEKLSLRNTNGTAKQTASKFAKDLVSRSCKCSV